MPKSGGEDSAKSARSQATSAAILRRATERFLRDGYAATSVRRIARDAGVDPALVLHYFGSKERLFLEITKVDGFWDDALARNRQWLRWHRWLLNRCECPSLVPEGHANRRRPPSRRPKPLHHMKPGRTQIHEAIPERFASLHPDRVRSVH